MTQTEAQKSAAKAKRTRKANLLIKANEAQKYKNALSRARTAENKLKAFKEGFEYALDKLGGKI